MQVVVPLSIVPALLVWSGLLTPDLVAEVIAIVIAELLLQLIRSGSDRTARQ